MGKYASVGKSLPRIDRAEKATGRANYSVDIAFPKMLYAKVLRSPHAHAKILKLPTALETPPMDVIMVESEEPNGPYGAKAVGRLAIIPTPSVIGNAVYNAAGIKVKDLPITPEKILEALGEKKS